MLQISFRIAIFIKIFAILLISHRSEKGKLSLVVSKSLNSRLFLYLVSFPSFFFKSQRIESSKFGCLRLPSASLVSHRIATKQIGSVRLCSALFNRIARPRSSFGPVVYLFSPRPSYVVREDIRRR